MKNSEVWVQPETVQCSRLVGENPPLQSPTSIDFNGRRCVARKIWLPPFSAEGVYYEDFLPC